MIDSMKRLPQSWFIQDAVTLAPLLLGKIIRLGDLAGRIVEVEAYTTDPASHAHKITPRSQGMWDTYGHWYVYFTYGMHYCMNVTTNKGGAGAILIRAAEPLSGTEIMKERRGTTDIRALCSGPAKLCQAFGVTKEHNGLPLSENFGIYDAPPIPPAEIVTATRIGIKKSVELPWRFYIKDSPFISRK